MLHCAVCIWRVLLVKTFPLRRGRFGASIVTQFMSLNIPGISR